MQQTRPGTFNARNPGLLGLPGGSQYEAAGPGTLALLNPVSHIAANTVPVVPTAQYFDQLYEMVTTAEKTSARPLSHAVMEDIVESPNVTWESLRSKLERAQVQAELLPAKPTPTTTADSIIDVLSAMAAKTSKPREAVATAPGDLPTAFVQAVGYMASDTPVDDPDVRGWTERISKMAHAMFPTAQATSPEGDPNAVVRALNEGSGIPGGRIWMCMHAASEVEGATMQTLPILQTAINDVQKYYGLGTQEEPDIEEEDPSLPLEVADIEIVLAPVPGFGFSSGLNLPAYACFVDRMPTELATYCAAGERHVFSVLPLPDATIEHALLTTTRVCATTLACLQSVPEVLGSNPTLFSLVQKQFPKIQLPLQQSHKSQVFMSFCQSIYHCYFRAITKQFGTALTASGNNDNQAQVNFGYLSELTPTGVSGDLMRVCTRDLSNFKLFFDDCFRSYSAGSGSPSQAPTILFPCLHLAHSTLVATSRHTRGQETDLGDHFSALTKNSQFFRALVGEMFGFPASATSFPTEQIKSFIYNTCHPNDLYPPLRTAIWSILHTPSPSLSVAYGNMYVALSSPMLGPYNPEYLAHVLSDTPADSTIHKPDPREVFQTVRSDLFLPRASNVVPIISNPILAGVLAPLVKEGITGNAEELSVDSVLMRLLCTDIFATSGYVMPVFCAARSLIMYFADVPIKKGNPIVDIIMAAARVLVQHPAWKLPQDDLLLMVWRASFVQAALAVSQRDAMSATEVFLGGVPPKCLDRLLPSGAFMPDHLPPLLTLSAMTIVNCLLTRVAPMITSTQSASFFPSVSDEEIVSGTVTGVSGVQETSNDLHCPLQSLKFASAVIGPAIVASYFSHREGAYIDGISFSDLGDSLQWLVSQGHAGQQAGVGHDLTVVFTRLLRNRHFSFAKWAETYQVSDPSVPRRLEMLSRQQVPLYNFGGQLSGEWLTPEKNPFSILSLAQYSNKAPVPIDMLMPCISEIVAAARRPPETITNQILTSFISSVPGVGSHGYETAPQIAGAWYTDSLRNCPARPPRSIKVQMYSAYALLLQAVQAQRNWRKTQRDSKSRARKYQQFSSPARRPYIPPEKRAQGKPEASPDEPVT